MSKYRFLIFIFIALSCRIFAQDYQLGFRYEVNMLNISTDIPIHRNTFTPDALELNTAYFPCKGLGLEVRLGADFFQEYYTGFEYGLLVKYFISNQTPNYYLLGGVMFHRNLADGGGTFSVQEQTLTLPAIGIGMNPAGAFNLEMLFQYGMNRTIAGDWVPINAFQVIHYQTKLNWVLKFGIGFSWSL